MKILLYAGAVLLSTTQSTLSKMVGKGGNPTVFNLNKSIAALFMFTLFGIFSFSFNVPTLLYGSAFGVILYVSTWSGLNALLCGPMALTSMLASFSLIIPCIYGICFLDEPLTLLTVIGFVLLASAFILISAKKKNDKNISAKWLVLTVTALVSNGVCSLILKLHQTRFPGQYKSEFMIYAYVVASIIFLISLLLKLPKEKTNYFDFKGCLAGIANGGANFLTIFLASMESASVMFPVISALTAVAVLSAGKIIFKEKLTVSQIIGFVLGIASVVLLNI